jgi:thioredoxin 1
MPITDVRTERELDVLLGDRETAVLDFWAPWCPPCREFLPVFEAAARRHPDLAFVRIDTQEAGALAEAFDVSSIPSLVVIRDRIMIASHAGYLGEAQLEDLLRQVRALDMATLREEMAHAQEESSNP